MKEKLGGCCSHVWQHEQSMSKLVTSLDVTSFILACTQFIDICGPVSNFYSDNAQTFKAVATLPPELLESDGLQSFFHKKGLSWEFIPPYSPAQGRFWESMIKVFKRTLSQVAKLSNGMPNLIELQTYVLNSTRLVKERPLTPLSDDPKDYSTITPSSLLNPAFQPSTPVGAPHDKDDLKHDYHFNVALVHRFWKIWMKFYLPLLQRGKKWLKTVNNLHIGQMVLVAEPDDINKRGNYKLGHVKLC